jgi:hypothetical protein
MRLDAMTVGIVGVLVGVSACQPLPPARRMMVIPTPVGMAPAPTVPMDQVRIYCSGGLGCQFDRLDDLSLDQADGRQTAVMQRDVVADRDQDLQQFVVTHAGTHHVRVHFYPVTKERAEQFVLIHRFKAGVAYRLHQYRDRNQQPSSLLAAATPDPLCIEVLENQRQIRRFCRPFDPQTGLGEFVEQSVAQ